MVENDFARSFFSASEHAAHHHGVGACGDSLGDVTREANATVSNQRNTCAFKRFSDITNRCNLRNADTSNDTCGANRSRSNTNLHSINAAIGKRLGGSARGDIATDHLQVRIVLFDPTNLC